jgi:hypothetical protein
MARSVHDGADDDSYEIKQRRGNEDAQISFAEQWGNDEQRQGNPLQYAPRHCFRFRCERKQDC